MPFYHWIIRVDKRIDSLGILFSNLTVQFTEEVVLIQFYLLKIISFLEILNQLRIYFCSVLCWFQINFFNSWSVFVSVALYTNLCETTPTKWDLTPDNQVRLELLLSIDLTISRKELCQWSFVPCNLSL